MKKPAKPPPGIEVALGGAKPPDEADNFYICLDCGQAVDNRELSAVLYHQIPGHKPLNLDS